MQRDDAFRICCACRYTDEKINDGRRCHTANGLKATTAHAMCETRGVKRTKAHEWMCECLQNRLRPYEHERNNRQAVRNLRLCLG